MNDQNTEQLLATLRHIMTAAGALLASKGYTTDATWQLVTGLVLAVAPLLWSLWQKVQQSKAVTNALYTPKPPGPIPDGVTPLPQPVSTPQGNGVPPGAFTALILTAIVAGSLCGCATAQKRVSYQTLASIQTAVDASMKVFAKAYVDGQVSEANKVKVFAIHEQYRACFATAVNAAKANYQALPAQDLVNIATSLVTTINTLTGKATP